MSTIQTSTDLPTLAAELADLNARIDALTGQADAIKAIIRETVPQPGKFEAGELTVTVTENRRFNVDKALRLLEKAELSPLRNLVVRHVPTVNKTLLQGLAEDGDNAAITVLKDATDALTWRVSVR